MWLHVPLSHLSTSPSAAEAEASTLDYALLGLALERSVTWRESYQRPRYWRKLLRSARFATLLSGLTCSASEAESGVASWQASLAASPANPIALQENDSELMTPETSGLSLRGWYGTLRQRGASSRTFQASFLTTTESYDQTLKPWATRLRRESSQRRRSARRIFGSASSGWPTAQVHDITTRGNTEADHHYKPHDLSNVAEMWQTPNSQNFASRQQPGQTEREDLLGGQAKNWQTPSVADTTGGHLSRERERSEELLLRGQAKAWSTASAHDGRRPGSDATSTQGRNLKREAESWSTPATRDHKGQDLPSRLGKSSLPAQVMQMAGEPTSESDPASSPRLLNPRFVLALMGWPDLIGYEVQETELHQWRQQMRSLLSRLGWEC